MKYIIILLIIVCLFFFMKNNIERFSQFSGYHCNSCFDRPRELCDSTCENCGFCVNKDGTGRCVPGDSKGPYYDECDVWQHGDHSSKFNFTVPWAD